MSIRSEARGYYKGMCAAVTWLHAEAARMNDPKAKRLLNAAAMRLGSSKPPPEGAGSQP
jgi:hypothetical protein